MNGKALLCLILSLVTALSLFSCGKKEKTPGDTAAETVTAETGRADAQHDSLEESDILSKVDSWLGGSSQGLLTEAGCYGTVEIDSAKDLDPYRACLYGFTPEDEARILADEKGKCFLVEMTGDTEHTLYSTVNILQQENVIQIIVNKCESEEETLPLHTYFLFYFPSDLYRGEEITVTF